MRIALVNVVWDTRATTPDETLDRFSTLTGWADAVAHIGRHTVVVCQRFQRDADVERSGVAYRFVRDGGPPKPAGWFGGSRRLIDSVISLRPDLVHVNGLDHPRFVQRLRRALLPRCPIVVQDHGGFDPLTLPAARKAWMRWGLAPADALLVATPPQAQRFRRSGLVPERVNVHGVMEGSTSLRADEHRERHQPLAVLWVGRLNANKDPLTVLDGFARFVARSGIDATLTFVYGSTELEAALRKALAPGGNADVLRSRVRQVGFVPQQELGAYYDAADLFVLGSHREGSGYALLEALACGVVPVVTDIPSFRWLTDDGRIGSLWRVGDAASLAEALERVAVRPIVAERRACRALFDRRFSWDAIGRRAVEIYQELVRT
jgi:glycosyltransferase involved in cell wall biosynthesis